MKELRKWIYEFKGVASYHNGEYSQGMFRVLEGLEGMVIYFENAEKRKRTEILEALKDLTRFCEENKVGAELELANTVIEKYDNI